MYLGDGPEARAGKLIQKLLEQLVNPPAKKVAISPYDTFVQIRKSYTFLEILYLACWKIAEMHLIFFEAKTMYYCLLGNCHNKYTN